MASVTPAAGITVVVADDHAIVRRGLVTLLHGDTGLRVVAEAGDVAEARQALLVHSPDVLVLDLNMPGGSSLAAIPLILLESPATAIVVLTMQDEPAFARSALQAGALGYVLKEAADAELVHAVRHASRGLSFVGERLRVLLATRLP